MKRLNTTFMTWNLPAAMRILDQLRAAVETVGRIDPDPVEPDLRDGVIGPCCEHRRDA